MPEGQNVLTPVDFAIRAKDIAPSVETLHSFKNAAKEVEQTLHPIHVIFDAVGNIGSGHANEALHIENTLRNQEIGAVDIEHWTVDMLDPRNSKLNRAISNLYAKMQKHPVLEKPLSALCRKASIAPLHRFIDRGITKDASIYVEEYLKRLENIPDSRPIIFHTTYVASSEISLLVAKELERRGKKAYVIEYIPDPSFSLGNYAYLMSGSTRFDNHIIVCHDNDAAERLAKVRKGVPVYALGTLSNPYLSQVFEPTGEKLQEDIPQELYLCPGNPRPAYNQAVLKRVEAKLDDIRSGRVKFTIHPMHHQSNYEFFKGIKEKYQLGDNFEIPEADSDLFNAVEHREDLKTKLSGYRDVFIGVTGGEQVLEKNSHDGHIVGALVGEGHEDLNIKTAVKDGQVIDLRDVDTKEWDELIDEASLIGQPNKRTGLANLAIALIKQPNLGKLWHFYEPLPEVKKKELPVNSPLHYLQEKWREAFGKQKELEMEMLLGMGMTRKEFTERIQKNTGFVFIAGGAASRFSKDAVTETGKTIMDILESDGFGRMNGQIDSRALVPLPNFLPDIPGDTVPTMIYSLYQIRDFLSNGGENLTIVYGNEADKTKMKESLESLGLDPEVISFVQQKIYEGRTKQAGNGDALKQAVESGILDRYENIVPLFNGDVHSANTLRRSLVAFEYAKHIKHPLTGLMPVAAMDVPKYPAQIDEDTGLPTGNFTQPKLEGKELIEKRGLSNVGDRIYDGFMLRRIMRHPELHHSKYLFLKGQSKQEVQRDGSIRELVENPELALDHIDQAFVRGGIVQYGIEWIGSNGKEKKSPNHESLIQVEGLTGEPNRYRLYNIASPDEITNSLKSPLNLVAHLCSLLRVQRSNEIMVNPDGIDGAKTRYETQGFVAI